MEQAISQFISYIKELKQPFVLILVGLPLSGKDTLIDRLGLKNIKILSRDGIIESLFPENSYREAYSSVDSKVIDKLFFNQLEEATNVKQSVLINATNLRIKRRRKINLRIPPEYVKLAIQLPVPSLEDYEQRNQNRRDQTGKHISRKVFEEMVNLFEPVTEEEGFDQIFRFHN
jgi:predicted kinase